ncbi:MAG: HEPN domain-containing protein [Campylobacterales bacterium]|nr:HEPN domain-containing protein [Campylobacterales bacterium]
MNKQSAIEWLTISYHDLLSAKILYDANHFTDSIGNDLQQSIEKSLKSIIAFQNLKIPKSHNLLEVYEYVKDKIEISDNEIIFLARATSYLKEDRYPNPNYSLPPRDEIKEVLDFTEQLFDKVCSVLEIDKKELTQ